MFLLTGIACVLFASVDVQLPALNQFSALSHVIAHKL
jgi:hypothetical protein